VANSSQRNHAGVRPDATPVTAAETFALIAILFVAGLLRFFAARHYWGWFDGQFPGLWAASETTLSQDATSYIDQAGAPGYADHLWGLQPYFRPPLASWYFAGLFPILAFDRMAVSAVQSCMAVLAYAAVFSVSRRVVGPRAALVAILAIAIHPVLIFFDRSFEDSVPALLFTALAVAALQRVSAQRRISDAVLCGLMFAAAALARSNLLLLAPFAGGWLYLTLRHAPEPTPAADVSPNRISLHLTRLGMVSCAIVALAVLGITAARLHRLPLSGVVLFGVPRYEQSLLALLLSLFAAYFCLIAYRSRIVFDGLVAAIVCGSAVVLLPYTGLLIIAAFMLFRRPTEKQASGLGYAPRAGLFSLTTAATLSLLCLLALASAHNWKAGAGAVPLASTIGQNLYWGNTPFVYQRTTIEGSSGVAWLSANEPTAVLLQGIMARYPSTNADEGMGKAVVADMRSDPVAAGIRFLDKARRGLASVEIGRNESFAYERSASPLFQLPLVPFWLIFGLAVCYPVLSDRYREAAILFIPWIVIFISETVFFNASRYRSLAVPFLLPLAVGGVRAIWEEMMQRIHPVRDAMLLGLIVVFGLLGETAVSGKELREEQATELFKMARLELYYVDHRFETDLKPARPLHMEGLLNRALEIDPDHLSAHYLRSMWQIDLGNVASVRESNAERLARCAQGDWLCKEVCNRIAEVANAPDIYRAQVAARVERTRSALTEASQALPSPPSGE
jgi:dolichyl-phosphate-mannose-protein mannosyltransferase